MEEIFCPNCGTTKADWGMKYCTSTGGHIADTIGVIVNEETPTADKFGQP